MDIPKLKYLKITGEISIKPVAPRRSEHARLVLIVGPTGAGKSSFIETLAGKSQRLSISKDQLEGYTQTVSAYNLVNVKKLNQQVWLIDTPGFSDSKISELKVLGMIWSWIQSIGSTYVDTILFLMPINSPRLAGSKRRTIDMFKALLEGRRGKMTFITTMWDAISNERALERAESNHLELRNVILKEFIDDGATIQRFLKTRESALYILNEEPKPTRDFHSPVSVWSPHRLHLYQDLHSRIENGLQAKKSIEDELAEPETEMYPELVSILENRRDANQKTLSTFIVQWMRFGKPPTELKFAAKDLLRAIVTDSDVIHRDSAYEDALYIWGILGFIPAACVPDESGTISDDTRSELRTHCKYANLDTRIIYASRVQKIIAIVLGTSEIANDIQLKSNLMGVQVQIQELLWEVFVLWVKLGKHPEVFEDGANRLYDAILFNWSINTLLDSDYKCIFTVWVENGCISDWCYPDKTGNFSAMARSELTRRRRYSYLLPQIISALRTRKLIDIILEHCGPVPNMEYEAILVQIRSDNQEVLRGAFVQWIRLGPKRHPDRLVAAANELCMSMTESDTGQLDPNYASVFAIGVDLGHVPDWCYPDESGNFSVEARTEFMARRQCCYLISRIQSALLAKRVMEVVLAHPETTTNIELKSMLEDRHAENRELLWKAIVQWIRNGQPRTMKYILDTPTRRLQQEIMAHSDLVQLDPAYEDFFYLWNTVASVHMADVPDESGTFSDPVRSALQRRSNLSIYLPQL